MLRFLVWTIGILVAPFTETGNRNGGEEENNKCSSDLNFNKNLMG